MSLINQMLQDLDSRRAVSGPKSGLPNEVRPLPPARRSNGPLIAGIGLAASLLAGWFVWQASDRQAAQPPRVEAPVTAQAPLPNASVTPGLPPSPVVPIAVPAAEIAVAPDVQSTADDEARLRMTTSLRLLPEREALPSVLPPVAPIAAPKAAASSPATVAASATPALAAAAPAAKPAGPMVLEKSAATGSPHERAEGEYRKALGLLNAGRTSEAIDSLRITLRQDAAHSAARQLLFKLLIESKRLDEAADLLQDGLQTQPAQISWAMSLGRLQIDRGDLPGAWLTLQRSLPFAANSADYQGFAAHVLQRSGKNREAAEHYQSATRLAPGEGRWWLGLGLALESAGQTAEAREALLRAKSSATLGTELSNLVDQKLRQLP